MNRTSNGTRLTCLDGGSVHAWHNSGLDVRGDKLVSVKTCVWCEREQLSKPRPHPQRIYS